MHVTSAARFAGSLSFLMALILGLAPRALSVARSAGSIIFPISILGLAPQALCRLLSQAKNIIRSSIFVQSQAGLFLVPHHLLLRLPGKVERCFFEVVVLLR